MLWKYAAAIQKFKPGSTVKIGTSDGVFEKFYVCLTACKRGFLVACRPFIGIDGCHLKGNFKGDLLVAVEKDANDNIFPIAYANVYGETKANWKWFLDLLFEDIGSPQDHAWTFISDRQNFTAGSGELFDEELLGVDHRFFVRHLWQNFKKQYNNQAFKDHMWNVARSYTLKKFQFHMKEIKELDENAYHYLMNVKLETWSRHVMGCNVKCDLLLNNMAESFNSFILEAREKPIITMMETIRRLQMKRFVNKVVGISKYDQRVCPRILKKLETIREDSLSCIITPSLNNKFEVTPSNENEIVIDLDKKTCMCRRWDMNGIPCFHVCAAIQYVNLNVDDYVHGCYIRETFLKAYQSPILPVPGPDYWPETEEYYAIHPPVIKNQTGRPRKQRRRQASEPPAPNHYKISQIRMVMTYSNCKAKGHNIRGCSKPINLGVAPKTRKKNDGSKTKCKSQITSASVVTTRSSNASK